MVAWPVILAQVVFCVCFLLAATFLFWDCLSVYFSKLSVSFDSCSFSYAVFNLSKWSFQLSVFLFSSSFNLSLYFTWSNCCCSLLKLSVLIIFCIACSYCSNSTNQFNIYIYISPNLPLIWWCQTKWYFFLQRAPKFLFPSFLLNELFPRQILEVCSHLHF